MMSLEERFRALLDDQSETAREVREMILSLLDAETGHPWAREVREVTTLSRLVNRVQNKGILFQARSESGVRASPFIAESRIDLKQGRVITLGNERSRRTLSVLQTQHELRSIGRRSASAAELLLWLEQTPGSEIRFPSLGAIYATGQILRISGEDWVVCADLFLGKPRVGTLLARNGFYERVSALLSFPLSTISRAD